MKPEQFTFLGIHWDLATILVLLAFITGLIWLYDILVLAPKRRRSKARLSTQYATPEDKQAAEHIPFWVDLSRSLFPVFVIVLFLRSFLVEPFRIPSNSMMPSLLTGDFILVNKFTYGIRLPVLNTKVIDIGSPQRGDVVVFRYPENPAIPFIKRVVGLPGDKVTYHNINKMLYINDEPVLQTRVGVYEGKGSGAVMNGSEKLIEHLSGVDHAILVYQRSLPQSKPVQEMVIPEGQYFVLGDNRDNSKDSRYWGTVPEENLIGKAFLIWMHWDSKINWPISWERLGMKIE